MEFFSGIHFNNGTASQFNALNALDKYLTQSHFKETVVYLSYANVTRIEIQNWVAEWINSANNINMDTNRTQPMASFVETIFCSPLT